MNVIPIPKETADLFVTTKHYSHRKSMYQHSFGLDIGGRIEGAVVYGPPPFMVAKHAFKDRDFPLLELTRLVVQTKEKNAASVLVGRSLKQLPSPCAVVSYADTEMGHCGIVYQATNWLYTGATVSHDHMYLIDGKRVHPRTLTSRGIKNPKQWAKENNIETVPPQEKHRYFFFVGDKREIRAMKEKCKYTLGIPYPKLPKSMYDDGPQVTVVTEEIM